MKKEIIAEATLAHEGQSCLTQTGQKQIGNFFITTWKLSEADMAEMLSNGELFIIEMGVVSDKTVCVVNPI